MQAEPAPPLTAKADSPHRKEGAPAARPGQPVEKAAAWKRLPPLPLSARGVSQGAKATAATRHAAQQAGSASRQQPHKSIKPEKASESQQRIAADRKVSDDQAADPGTSSNQHQQQLAGKISQAGDSRGGQQGERHGFVDSSGSKVQKPVVASDSEQASINKAPCHVELTQAQQQAASSKGGPPASAITSHPASSAPCAETSTDAGGGSTASRRNAAELVGTIGTQQTGVGERAGQQQVARLTASNTALLAELVDLQVRCQLEFLYIAASCLPVAVEHKSERGTGATLAMLLRSNHWPCSKVGHMLPIAECVKVIITGIPANCWPGTY